MEREVCSVDPLFDKGSVFQFLFALWRRMRDAPPTRVHPVLLIVFVRRYFSLPTLLISNTFFVDTVGISF